MTTTPKDKKKRAKSPYQKYGKTAYRYSDTYHKWRAAILQGHTGEANRLSAEHQRRFMNMEVAA